MYQTDLSGPHSIFHATLSPISRHVYCCQGAQQADDVTMSMTSSFFVGSSNVIVLAILWRWLVLLLRIMKAEPRVNTRIRQQRVTSLRTERRVRLLSVVWLLLFLRASAAVFINISIMKLLFFRIGASTASCSVLAGLDGLRRCLAN